MGTHVTSCLYMLDCPEGCHATECYSDRRLETIQWDGNELGDAGWQRGLDEM